MIGSLLVAVLVAGGSGDMAKLQVKALELKVPATWAQTEQEGSQRFADPSGDAYFLLDVGEVQTQGMKAKVCLDKILAAMGGEGWERIKLGGSPAARQVTVDDAPDDEGSVETVTYVGCNGKTTWSLVFHMDAEQKEKFEPIAAQVARSVAYAKGK
jgi:hypothetical protein